MNTIKAVILWLCAVVLVGALSYGLYITDKRRTEAEAVKREDLIKSIEAVNDARKTYYQQIADQKLQNTQQMADAKVRYEELKKQQPDLVASHKTQQTQVVQETVPVQYTVPVTTAPSKTAPTRTTRTS